MMIRVGTRRQRITTRCDCLASISAARGTPPSLRCFGRFLPLLILCGVCGVSWCPMPVRASVSSSVEPLRFLSHRLPCAGAPHLVCVSHTDTRTSDPSVVRISSIRDFFSKSCACLSPPPLCVSVTFVVDAPRQISRARVRLAFLMHLSLLRSHPPHYRHTHIASSAYM